MTETLNAEHLPNIISRVLNNQLVFLDIENGKRLCPYKFNSLYQLNEKEQLTLLSWGWYLGVLVKFRNGRSWPYQDKVNRSAMYFDLAEKTLSPTDMKKYIRRVIPDIKSAMQDLQMEITK